MKKQLLSIITFCSILGGVNHAKAQAGAALNFDGNNDMVNVGNSMNTVLNSQNTITVEAWIYPTSTTGSFKTIIGNYSTPLNQMQFDMRLQGNSVVFFVNCGAGYQFAQTPSNSISLNTWQHIAGVWDGNNLFIYINGVLSDAACCATGSSFAATTNSVVIGGNTVPEMFNGSLDEIRIWTRPLCQGEIQNNMNGELALPQTGLLAYYQFNEGVASNTNSAVTTLTDVTGNGYDGTLTNFALTGASSNWITPGGVTSGVNAPAFVSPSISISGPSVIGAGSSATYTAAGNVTTYTWSVNAGSANTSTVTVSPTLTTTYSVVGTNSVGCISNTAVQTLTVSPVGEALNFDGTANDQINMGTSMTTTMGTFSVLTVEAWVNPATISSSNYGEIIGNYNSPNGNMQFMLRQQNDAYAFFADPGSGFQQVTSPAGSATANLWQHVAGVWDGNNLMIYINGVLQATQTGVTGPNLNNTITNAVVMGYEPAGSGEGFIGNMDEVRIWSIARTQCQINNSMNCELASTDRAGLFAYYKFNEGIANNNNPTVTTLTDSSGNGYDGALNAGFALTGTTSNWVAPGGVTMGVSCGPIVNPTVTVNNATICAGTTTTLTASGASTYSWSTSATTASITATPTLTSNYTVTGADANYCMATAIATVTVNPGPVISSQSGNVYVCGDSVNKSFTVNSPGANTYQWYWNSGAGTLISSGGTANVGSYQETNYTTNNMTILVNQSDWGPSGTQGVYCVVTNTFNCIATTAFDTMFFNPLPVNTTTLNGLVITANLTGGTYQWINCSNNTAIAGATAQSYTATVNGNYKVVVNNGTCSDTSTCVSINTVGIAQYGATTNLQVYPNPFSNELTIVSPGKTNALLFDMLGNKINEFVLQNPTQTISLGDLAPGMYYLQIDSQKIKISKQ